MSSPDVLNLSIASNRSSEKRSSIPEFFFSFLFLTRDRACSSKRKVYRERQWNIARSGPYSVFISALFYSPLRKPRIIFIFIFSFFPFFFFLSLYLSISRCFLRYFSRPRNCYKIRTVGESRTTRLDHATGECLDSPTSKNVQLVRACTSIFFGLSATCSLARSRVNRITVEARSRSVVELRFFSVKSIRECLIHHRGKFPTPGMALISLFAI